MNASLRWVCRCLPVLLAPLAPLAPLASACEPQTVDAVLRDAFPQARIEVDGRALASADRHVLRSEVQCRRWPAQPGRLLLALHWRSAEDGDGLSKGDLEVLVADADRHSVIARHRADGRLVSDAVSIDGLSLDTARYDLTPSVRAFGVRIDASGSSRVNPFHEQTLDLYVLAAGELQPVLQRLVVATDWAEWDGVCAGEHASSRATVVVMAPAATLPATRAVAPGPGHADLGVRSEHRHWTSHHGDGGCTDSGTRRSRTDVRLRFDGRRYPLPGG